MVTMFIFFFNKYVKMTTTSSQSFSNLKDPGNLMVD
jgi:hypothetical protein